MYRFLAALCGAAILTISCVAYLSTAALPNVENGSNGELVLGQAQVQGQKQAVQACVTGQRFMPCATPEGYSGQQKQLCVDGNWKNSGVCVVVKLPCTEGKKQLVGCTTSDGQEGTREQTCTKGKWSDAGSCVAATLESNPQHCTKGAPPKHRPCLSGNKAGTQTLTCRDGKWAVGSCIVIHQQKGPTQK